MRVVIVEDNELDLESLCILLEGFDTCELVGSASTIEEGLQLILKERPDLVFLDVQVGEQNSLNHLDRLDYEPAIICTTLYEKHALKAFNVGAMDYLSKPLTKAKLSRALQRYMSRVEPTQLEPHTVLIKNGSVSHVLLVDDILLIRGERDYTSVAVRSGQAHLCGYRMTDWHELLTEQQFVKLDRSTIVNRSEIKSFSKPLSDSSGQIVFRNGLSVEIGTTAFKRLQALYM